jgi:hypothetical protein
MCSLSYFATFRLRVLILCLEYDWSSEFEGLMYDYGPEILNEDLI